MDMSIFQCKTAKIPTFLQKIIKIRQQAKNNRPRLLQIGGSL